VEVKDARGVVITGNTFWEGFQHDVLVERSSHVVVSSNNFDRNPRYLVNGFDNAECNGLVFVDCEDSVVTGNVIGGVWKKRAALDLIRCKRMQVCQNSVLDSDGIGLLLEEVSESVVTGNLIRDDREGAVNGKPVSLLQRKSGGNLVQGNLLGNGEKSE
jgi:nitrous oxidase accessory protein NosD